MCSNAARCTPSAISCRSSSGMSSAIRCSLEILPVSGSVMYLTSLSTAVIRPEKLMSMLLILLPPPVLISGGAMLHPHLVLLLSMATSLLVGGVYHSCLWPCFSKYVRAVKLDVSPFTLGGSRPLSRDVKAKSSRSAPYMVLLALSRTCVGSTTRATLSRHSPTAMSSVLPRIVWSVREEELMRIVWPPEARTERMGNAGVRVPVPFVRGFEPRVGVSLRAS